MTNDKEHVVEEFLYDTLQKKPFGRAGEKVHP
jgi:hypothetical protein